MDEPKFVEESQKEDFKKEEGHKEEDFGPEASEKEGGKCISFAPNPMRRCKPDGRERYGRKRYIF